MHGYSSLKPKTQLVYFDHYKVKWKQSKDSLSERL